MHTNPATIDWVIHTPVCFKSRVKVRNIVIGIPKT